MKITENDRISKVCINKSSYSDIDLKLLLNPLGGIQKYVDKNDKVLLKVNLLNASTPNQAVVTHPNLVESLIYEIKKAGGIPYIGDSPSGQFSKKRLEKVYLKAGLIELANKLDIELNYDTRSTKINIDPDIQRKKPITLKGLISLAKTPLHPKLQK